MGSKTEQEPPGVTTEETDSPKGNHVVGSGSFPEAWAHEALVNCELLVYCILIINFPFLIKQIHGGFVICQ